MSKYNGGQGSLSSSANKNSTRKGRYTQTEADKYAEQFLLKIEDCINSRLKGQPQLKSAVISNVNEDGTVDVYFPPNKDNIFTRIQNQSIYELEVGDSVEILLKDGTFNNCWILAKHQSDKLRRIQMQEARITYVSGGGSSTGGGGGTVTGAVRYDTEQTLTDPQKEQARINIGAGTSNFSGNYEDLENKPTIPTIPENISAFNNDAGYVTETEMNDAIATADQALKQEIMNLLTGYYSEDNPPPYPVTSVDGEIGAVELSDVKYTAQTLTDEQKAQARQNIGAGNSSFDGSYNSLTDKPTIPTTVAELTDSDEYVKPDSPVFDDYAKLDSPTFTGTPKTVTTAITSNDDSIASTQFVQDLVANVTGGSVSGPETAVDGDVVLFDGTTGKIVKDSNINVARINALSSAVLSPTEPTDQQVGDIWFKEL